MKLPEMRSVQNVNHNFYRHLIFLLFYISITFLKLPAPPRAALLVNYIAFSISSELNRPFGYCRNGIRYIRSGIVLFWKLSTLRHRGKICIHICCVCFVQTALLPTYCSPHLVNKTELRKINLFQTNLLRRILRF